MTKVAFVVQETEEWTGDIFFANRPIDARKAGANEFNDGEIGGLSVKRAHWADKYLGKGVPARELIARGWHFDSCSGCGLRLDEDSLHDAGKPLSGVVGTTGSAIYCCGKCHWRDMRRRQRAKLEGERAFAAMKEMVLRRLPDAEICDDHEDGYRRNHHVYVVEGPRGGFHWQQVTVAFRFPGMKIGPAHYELRAELYGKQMGPVAAHFTCCSGDREAFEAWAAATKAAA